MTTEAELTTARDQARDLATARPTSRNRTALKKAQAALDHYHAQQAHPAADGDAFSSILGVVAYLETKGFKISKTTAYEHWKKDGKIKANPDGTFSRAEVDLYAADHLQRKDGSKDSDNSSEIKRRAEIRRIEADANMRELKFKSAAGEYIPRSQVEIELSDRASHLKGYLDAVARSMAGKIIKLVKGDPQQAPDLIAFLLGTNRKAFDNYSRPIQGLEDEEE